MNCSGKCSRGQESEASIVRALNGLRFLAPPWPAAFELECEAPAQERADCHYHRQDYHAVHSWRERHGADDVGGDQHLEPKQDGATEILPQALVWSGVLACTHHVAERRDDESAHDQGHAGNLGGVACKLYKISHLHRVPHEAAAHDGAWTLGGF